MNVQLSYGQALLAAHRDLLAAHESVIVMGQGVWSPWYVGETMTDLDVEFGRSRVIDTPVSEAAVTAAAVGASLTGLKPLVVHPRVDFALLALDPIVNQAAKWRSMFGGAASPPVTFRLIVNRGGEQGAQHSQALHSWFAHVPGLRVVLPASPRDAYELLCASVLSDDPVVFIDDRWLYASSQILTEPLTMNVDLKSVEPRCIRSGSDVTIVAAGYSVALASEAATWLAAEGIEADVFDLRQISPLNVDAIVDSVGVTGSLAVVDGDWGPCGISSEVICRVVEVVHPASLRSSPIRVTIPFAPAPTSKLLESIYYPTAEVVASTVSRMLEGS